MATDTILLPGDVVPPTSIPTPSNSKKALTLGPGLHHTPPATITAHTLGSLQSSTKKNAIWLDGLQSGRYVPATGDNVIATVHHASGEYLHCEISPHTPYALLPVLAFEGATRRTRPMLQAGALVYAKVTAAGRDAEVELSCVNEATGKAEGMGPLKDGMLFKVSLGFARRLLQGKLRQAGVVVLEELEAQGLSWEMVVGRNGKVWVDASDTRETLLVGNCLMKTDEGRLGVEEQVALVKKTRKG